MSKKIEVFIDEPDLPRYEVKTLEPLQGELKKLTPENEQKLRNLITRKGFKLVPHIWQNGGVNYLIDGHQRVHVLKGLAANGWEVPPIPCVRIQAKNYHEAKDTVLLAVTQHGKLNKPGFVEFVDGEDFDFDDLDFPDVDDDFFDLPEDEEEKALKEEKEDDVPEIEENENPYGVQRGDVWVLGNHRIMNGDSTNEADVAKLMDGEKADMVFTDPPYNVDMGSNTHEKFKQRSILNDSMTSEEFIDFSEKIALSIKRNTDGCVYVFAPPGIDGRTLFNPLDRELHCSTTIIWVKDSFVLGRAKYHNRYEPCWFGWHKDGKSYSGGRDKDNVWEFKRPKASKLHPTSKPVELVQYALSNHSEAKSVLDLFGGSGTTLIAAEKLGKKSFLMELDVKYMNVIIKRWEEYTGKTAERISNG